MRIGTWNVEYALGPRNRDRLAVLRAHDADIWVLTETHDRLDLSGTHTPVHAAPRPGQPEGARWVSLWTRWPVLARLAVTDARRSVCALLDGPGGPHLVYGTVLPWHTDRGDPPTDASTMPAPANWAEHHRVIPEQGADWARLRSSYPDAVLWVAGDFNSGIHRGYGTTRGRALLATAMGQAGLRCLTADAVQADGQPFIDHICTTAAPTQTRPVTWPGRSNGLRLSDHDGVAATVSLRAAASGGVTR